MNNNNTASDSTYRTWNKLKVDYMGNVYSVSAKKEYLKRIPPQNGFIHTSVPIKDADGSISNKMRNIAHCRIVWEAWTGETLTECDIIEFKDRNPKNCCFSNLIKETAADWHGLKVSSTGVVYKPKDNNLKSLHPTEAGGIHYYEEVDGKQELRCVNRSRIVYEAFSGETLTLADLIEFKDGNSDNCAYENLKRVSLSDYRDKNQKNKKKKLTREEWNKIRQIYEAAQANPKMKDQLGISFRYFTKQKRYDENGKVILDKNGRPEHLCSLSTVQKVLAVDENGNYLYDYDEKGPKQTK